MNVDIKELIKKVKKIKQRLYDINLGFEDDEHLDSDDFTLAVVIACLESIEDE